MKACKLCSAPVSMRFDGDDTHFLYPDGSRWFGSKSERKTKESKCDATTLIIS